MTPPRAAGFALATDTITAPVAEARERTADWSRDQFHYAVVPLMPRLFRLCLALSRNDATAEDLLQASLVRAYLRRSSFAETGSFFGWLCQIIRNVHRDDCRTAARRRALFDEARERFEILTDSVSLSTVDPEEWHCCSDDSALLMECLRDVPETYRVVLLLCDIEQMTQAETAATLGLPIGTVKSRQMRGRRLLRRAYERRSANGGESR
jgi:RNA polymerase sigma-70 factor (ECF subfamily)